MNPPELEARLERKTEPVYNSACRATMLLGPDRAVESAPLDNEPQAWEGIPDSAMGY